MDGRLLHNDLFVTLMDVQSLKITLMDVQSFCLIAAVHITKLYSDVSMHSTSSLL